jgi:hypothetical protein
LSLSSSFLLVFPESTGYLSQAWGVGGVCDSGFLGSFDECNHGKGNWDQTDWRPEEVDSEVVALLRDIARNGYITLARTMGKRWNT